MVAEEVAHRAKMFCIIYGTLYRGGGNGVYDLEISGEEGRALLADIHSGVCSSHVVLRAMAGTAFR
jgi:hypothetical protein